MVYKRMLSERERSLRAAVARCVIEALESRQMLSVDDGYENNDTFETATPLGTINGRRVVDNLAALDDDYFSFTLSAAGASANFVRIEFTQANGDLDLYVYDQSKLVAKSDGVRDNEQVTLSGLPAGDYYVLVHGYDGAQNASYRLIVDAPNGADDSLEPNNSLAAASDLGPIAGQFVREGLAEFDDDWYRFATSDTGTASSFAQIDFAHSDGDLDLELRDSAGTLIERSESVTDRERISLDGQPAGTYYLHAYGYAAASNSQYTLTIDAPEVVSQGDRFESNNDFDSATNLSTLQGAHDYSDLSISSGGDVDFLRFTMAADGTANDGISLTFADADGDLDMQLFDADQQYLAVSQGVTDNEYISLSGLSAGTYYLYIYGYEGATNRYDLHITTPQLTLPPDKSEPNDTLQTARDLGTTKGGLTAADLTIHNATDEDYYKFTTSATGSSGDSASIQFTNAVGDLDMELLDASGNSLGTSDGTANTEQVSLSGLPAGTYYVHVWGYAGAANGYTLQIDAPAGPAAPDSYEGAEPVRLSQSQTIDHLSIHDPAMWSGAGDAIDRFTFTMPDAGTISSYVEIRFDHALGALDLAVFDAGHVACGTLEGSADDVRVSLAGLAAGTYSIEVTGATNPDYSLTLSAPFGGDPLPGWTVLVYMDGDNNLEGAAIEDINEMEAVQLPANLRVGVLLDRTPGYDTSNSGWTDTRAGVLQYDANPYTVSTPLTSWGERDMGNPATLLEFIQWGKAALPAQHYALVLWDHGSAGVGSMWDDTDGEDYLALADLRTVLAGAGVSVLGFDACLMQSAETVGEVESSVDFVVASEETEGGDGWDYTRVLQSLADNPPTTPQQFGNLVVNANRGNPALATLSVVAARNNRLGDALTSFVNQVQSKATSADWVNLAAAREAAIHYYDADFRDLYSFMSDVSNRVTTADIRTAAAIVLAAIDADVGVSYTAWGVGGYGISIYLPSAGSGYWGPYSSLDFGRETGWATFARVLATRSGGQSGIARDWAESNDLRATARDLGTLAGHGLDFPNLSIHTAGDVDWFRFTTATAGAPGDRVTVGSGPTLSLSNAAGNAVGQAISGGISLDGLPAGQYFARISGAAISTYTLLIDAPSTNAAPANSTSDKATAIRLGEYYGGLAVGAGQSQWYSISADRVPVTDPLVISADFPAGSGLQMTLYSKTGQVLAQSSPTESGASVSYNDFDAGRFLLQVSGTSSSTVTYGLQAAHESPEIDIVGHDCTIPAGSATPDTTTGTNFGNAGVIGDMIVRTFTVRNVGTQPLNIIGMPTITGASAGDFELLSIPGSPIPAGWEADFQVAFDPRKRGLRTATITIANDDRTEGAYTFTVQGTGVRSPEVAVVTKIKGHNRQLADGQQSPAVSFGTARRFVTMPLRTFTIYNQGDATLRLTSNHLPKGFRFVQAPPKKLAAGKHATFSVALVTGKAGAFAGDVRLATNDLDESVFNFRVTGSVRAGRTTQSQSMVLTRAAGASAAATPAPIAVFARRSIAEELLGVGAEFSL